jgi:hypothetical protein
MEYDFENKMLTSFDNDYTNPRGIKKAEFIVTKIININ